MSGTDLSYVIELARRWNKLAEAPRPSGQAPPACRPPTADETEDVEVSLVTCAATSVQKPDVVARARYGPNR